MLAELKKLLEKDGFSVLTKGKGESLFLYVKGQAGCAEISMHDDKLWIEIWDSTDEETDDGPIKEITCETVEEACKELNSWIK